MNPDPTSLPTPRIDIPDSWGKNGHCPACASAPLEVVHITDGADYLICRKCELSFEVAAAGGQIRIKNVPENLGFAETELRFHWVAPKSLQPLLENRQSIIRQKSLNQKKAELDPDDVWERTLSFHRLGNKPKKIELILIQAGASQEQASAALARLKIYIDQEAKRQNRKLAWLGGLTVVIIAMLFGGWYMLMSQIGTTLNQGLAGGTGNQAPLVPLLPAANILPDAVKPEFLKSAPVKVSSSGPARSRCPNTSQQAAKLFGGRAEAWQMASQPGAWQMIDTGSPVIVRVPDGMIAGYIDNTTFMFLSSNGPATIQNVNFLVIMCE